MYGLEGRLSCAFPGAESCRFTWGPQPLPRDCPSAHALEVERIEGDFKLMHYPVARQAQQEIWYTPAGDPGCVREGARPGLSPKGPEANATRLPGRWHRCACKSRRARVILGDKGLPGTVADIRQLSRPGGHRLSSFRTYLRQLAASYVPRLI